MIAILTVLVALPLGLLLKRRLHAYVAYGLAFAHVYTFQTASLLIEWSNGERAAFAADGTPWGYLAFTTVIYAAGFGLVTLGHWLRSRRRTAGVDLAAAER